MLAHLRGVRFQYSSDGSGGFTLSVPEFSVQARERVAVVGPSGCGKSTLLGLISGVLRAQQGSVHVGNLDLSTARASAVRQQRASRIGLVHQDFQLFDALTVEENILLPFHVCGALHLDRAARERAQQLAERAGVAHVLRRSVTRLSQGERQRVAVCRALAATPRIVLADEPTASLDYKTRDRVVQLLLDECTRAEASIVAATHDAELLQHFGRVVHVATDGSGTLAEVGGGAS